MLTRERAGVLEGAGAWNAEAVKQIAPIANRGLVKISLRTALVLGLAGVSELRIGAMFDEEVRAFFVV